MANASTYLHRTFTAGNQRKFTGSVWFKRARLTSGYEKIMQGRDGSDSYDTSISFDPTDHIRFESWHNGAYTGGRRHTTRVFRDIAAWTHLVFVVDSENATAEDRMQIWINGVRETSFSTNVACTQDTDFYINKAGATNYIGSHSGSTDANCFTGQFAHYHFCDGQAYSASDFGEFDSTSGIWVAKTSPSVTYGENGFFLKFASGASGTDSSGEGNNMTVVGTLTNNKDNPDNNFATWNVLAQPNGTLSNGNTSNSGCEDIGATLGAIKGKWYWEYKRTNTTNSLHYGICSTKGGFNCAPQQMLNTGTNAVGSCIYISEGGTGNTTYGSAGGGFSSPSYSVPAFSIANGDVVGCALDISTSSGTVEWFKNGTSLGSASFTYDQVTEVYPFIRMNSGATTDTNFGNGYFGTTAISSAGTSSSGDDSVWEYNCPADHYGFNTKNIATYG